MEMLELDINKQFNGELGAIEQWFYAPCIGPSENLYSPLDSSVLGE
jgi:hypothetical protein